MSTVSEFLESHGPSRSSAVAEWLVKEQKLTPEAARKRISRIRPPLYRFPVQLLPKGESFIYLKEQRKEDRFWINFHQAMRDTGSIFGSAIDGLLARHGAVLEEEFAVISGATARPMRGQLTATTVVDRLIHAGVVDRQPHSDGVHYIRLIRSEFDVFPSVHDLNARMLAEGIVLEGLREWSRKLGLASYNKITVRREATRVPIGPFLFDLAGPSYLLPLKGKGRQPGFLVADVFVDQTLDHVQIQYFIRKASMLHTLLKGTGLLAILVADGFTGPALTAGRAAGIALATPRDLFGKRAGIAIQTLSQTLNNAAAYASSAPERLVRLINDLSEIEGAAGNIRGILFELLAAYLARRNAVSIDMGVRAQHPTTGKTADIDILQITHQRASCIAIECKGKAPGGTVTITEAQDWIRRIPTFQAFLRSRVDLREAALAFELWTSGEFDPEAKEYLQTERDKRTKVSIRWKNGADVLAIAHSGKEKSIADALNQHFIHHPLVEVAVSERSPESSPPTQISEPENEI